MGLFRVIKGKMAARRMENEEVEEIREEKVHILRRDDIDVHDGVQRENYVKACLEQLAEASRELETLGGEYNLVTSYLTDMEEIEEIAPEIKEQIKGCAKKLVEIDNDTKLAEDKPRVMSDEDYARMEKLEEYMPAAYDKLKEAEDYQVNIKRDLGRLDGEKQAYEYRRHELAERQHNMKGIVGICVGSMLLLVVTLASIAALWQLDVEIGYVIAVLVAAVAMTVVYVKFTEAGKELTKVEKAQNKLTLLENTVKIKYVNNTNLLEYLYVKYDVNSSSELKKLWAKYVQEKARREEEKERRRELDSYQCSLLKLLRRCKVKDADRWLHQAIALYDNREMVEIRHSLIIRRQKLRKQMEYNAKIAQEAQDEVKELVAQYPQYAGRVLDMVSEYEDKALA